ncbi:MAG: HigA family addiction module antitoxin [Anaerolineae bacterium]
MTEKELLFEPDWLSPPGDTIADVLEERGWSRVEFAQRIGYTPKHVNQLLRGKAPISEDTALRLERVLGSTARFWLQRETEYREALARRAEAVTLSSESSWLGELPLDDMIRFKWITDYRHNPAAQVGECLSFFGVASVAAWRERYIAPLAAYRASKRYERQPGAVAAWLRQGERRAAAIDLAPFQRKIFQERLDELRDLTNELDPEIFVPRMMDLCASAGVAVVLEPAPHGCPVSGAVRWLTPETALLMLSLRYKTNDQLWFPFFHEAGHLLLHGKRLTFFEIEGELGDDDEVEADAFARNFLIPSAQARQLTEMRSEASVVQFARGIGIAPGIVVGRMQKEGWLPWSHLNGLKVRYTWTQE